MAVSGHSYGVRAAGEAMTATCKGCGVEFGYTYMTGRAPGYCTVACRKAVFAKVKREAKQARRDMMRHEGAERVDPFKLFDRDGWKCRLCGVDTPRKLRGTSSMNAPEVDHIVPLSKCGAHTYQNTQCACRRCNLAKSDTMLPNISANDDISEMLRGNNRNVAEGTCQSCNRSTP